MKFGVFLLFSFEKDDDDDFFVSWLSSVQKIKIKIKMPVCIIFKKKRRFKDDGADTTSAYKNTSSFSKLPEQSIIKQEK